MIKLQHTYHRFDKHDFSKTTIYGKLLIKSSKKEQK